jgi:hypothetical protein
MSFPPELHKSPVAPLFQRGAVRIETVRSLTLTAKSLHAASALSPPLKKGKQGDLIFSQLPPFRGEHKGTKRLEHVYLKVDDCRTGQTQARWAWLAGL